MTSRTQNNRPLAKATNIASQHQQLLRAKSCLSEPLQPNARIPLSRNNSVISTPPQYPPSCIHPMQTATKKNDYRQTSSAVHPGRVPKTPHHPSNVQSVWSMTNVQIHVRDAFGQDANFNDAPSDDPGQGAFLTQHSGIVELSPSDILNRCDETDYKDVYEISLHATHLVKIQHFDKFTKLRSLDLSGNYIATIENLQNNLELRELKLYDNEIIQIANLEWLKDLTHLHLQHNRIQVIGKGLKGLVRLRVLRLDYNRILRLDAGELSSCTQLTSLDISNNYLDNIATVASLSNLEELYVRHNNLKKLNDLSRCKKLQEVDLSYNPLSDLSGLKDILSIRFLNVSHCQLSSFSTLGKLKDLEELNASHCQLRTIKPLSQYFPSLQILNVSDNLIASKDDLSALKSVGELVELSISGNPFCNLLPSRNALISTVLSYLPNLQVLESVNLIQMSSQPSTALLSPAALMPKSDPNLNSQMSETPLARPSSTTSKIGDKLMEKQLSDIETQLMSFEAEFSSRIQDLKTSIKVLPESVRSSREGSQRTGSVQSSSGSKRSRPTSRCRTRSRLEDAMTFADHHFRSS